jgi:uncharacterized protein
MAGSVLVDASFLVAFLDRHEKHHAWAAAQAREYGPPWLTCESVLSETFHLLGSRALRSISALFERGSLSVSFRLDDHHESVLALMEKYAGVPMSFADACLVRMSEILREPLVLTTDSDFLVYRRHSRQVVPCVIPG